MSAAVADEEITASIPLGFSGPPHPDAFELPSTSDSEDSDGQGGWEWVAGFPPHVTWRGGQKAFPGGWLQLSEANFKDIDTSACRPLVWDRLHEVYVPSAEPFQLTHHVLDRSPETLELSAEVARWGNEVAGREDSGENKLYVQIAKAMAEKLSKLEEEVRPDCTVKTPVQQ
eukprot:1074984-Prorocentrum_minimum.AAC.3